MFPGNVTSKMATSAAVAESREAVLKHPTGSQYKGPLKNGRMEGRAEYVFPSGTKYIGDMEDGMFHGRGTLYFPNGGKFEAEWERGRAVGPTGSGGQYTFKDGLQFQEVDWRYCDRVDRRFWTEICHGIKPAGRTQVTDRRPETEVPLGWYDCGDGLYNPQNRVVYSHTMTFLRNADIDEHDWIVRTCRKGVTPEEQFHH